MSVRPIARLFLVRLGLPVGLALLLAVLYLSRYGLPDRVTARILRGLQRPHLAVTVENVRLSVFEGLVATGVRFYRMGDIGPALLESEEVVLHFAPSEWVRGRVGLMGVRVRDGIARIPLGSDGAWAAGLASTSAGRYLSLKDVNAVLKMDDPGAVRIAELHASLADIRILARGTLLLEAPVRSGFPGRAGNGIAPEAVLNWLSSGAAGRMLNAEVEFFVRPSDMSQSVFKLTARGGGTELGQIQIEAWSGTVLFKGVAGEGEFKARNVIAAGAPIESIDCRFVVDTKRLTIESLDATVGTGPRAGPLTLKGAWDFEHATFDGRLSTGFDPVLLVKPLAANRLRHQARAIEDFRFPAGPPVMEAGFWGQVGSNVLFRIGGRIEARRPVYRGVSCERAEALFELNELPGGGTLEFEQLRIWRPEGVAEGYLGLNFRQGLVDFEVVSDISPKELAVWIGPFMTNVAGFFQYRGPVVMRGAGTVSYRNMAGNDIEVSVEAARLGVLGCMADSCSFTVRVLGDTIEIRDVRGMASGGCFSGSAIITPGVGGDGMCFHAVASLEGADFRRWAALWSSAPSRYTGRLSGRIECSGSLGAAWRNTLCGTGRISVADGRIFQIPLFGGLSSILGQFVPGLNWLMSQTDGSAEFEIWDGRVSSDDIWVDGDVLSLAAKGDCGLDGSLNFDVQMKLLRRHTLAADLLRFVTWPVTKMFELRLGGTLREPVWGLRHMPRDIFGIFGAGAESQK